MEDRRRTRSQGPPSLSEDNELQWGSLQDPVRIEREHAEACRIIRQLNTVNNVSENTVENSEIPQVTTEQLQHTKNTPQSGEISPKQHENQVWNSIAPTLVEILPNREERVGLRHNMLNLSEIPPKETQQASELVAMEEGITVNTHTEERDLQSDQNTRQKSPQIETAQHYLDDNFSDVMRSSALGSNVSSLFFNTTALNNTHNEQKVTLNWILPDGRNS